MRSLFCSIFLMAVMSSAVAELTYPVNVDDWKGRTAYLDTDTGQITQRGRDWPATDPDTYTCPDCGVNPGWSSNISPLRELDKQIIPDYDSNLYSLSLDEIVCGPVAGSLDARCEGQTDVIKKVWSTETRPVSEQKNSANNAAAYQTLLQMPEDQFRLHVLVQLGLNMQRLDSSSLAPKWQAVNDAHWTWLVNKVLPIWDHRKELLDAIDAGTISGGDIDSGWPVVNSGDLPE